MKKFHIQLGATILASCVSSFFGTRLLHQVEEINKEGDKKTLRLVTAAMLLSTVFSIVIIYNQIQQNNNTGLLK